MVKKKILVVSRYFYPTITPRSFRTTELVIEFAKQGHEVTLLTFRDSDSHDKFEQENNINIKDLGKLKFPAININSGSKIAVIFKRILKRGLKILFEYPDIEILFKVKRALKGIEGYDTLISVAVPYPVHWGVAWSRTKNHPIAKTWVADCGDPYMGDTTDSFKKIFYFKYIEKWFSRKADVISIPRIEMKTNFYKEFHQKIVGIPQGFNFNGVRNINDFIKNSIPTFAFAGTFIPKARDPRELLDYLSHLSIDYKFVVYTKNPGLLVPYMAKLNNKLEILNYVPRNELIETLSKMDFLVNISYDPVYQAPSKLIDYSITGRPILNITTPLDTKTIDSFMNGDYENAFQLEDLDQYRIEKVASAFLEQAPIRTKLSANV